jgi:hypothetical protein
MRTVGWQVPRLVHDAPPAADRPAAADPGFTYLWPSARTAWQARRDSLRADAGGLVSREAVRQRELVGLLARAGVRLAVGTGTRAGTGTWGATVHDELTLLAAAGLAPAAVLRAGTLEPARATGLADSTGTITAGKLADLVLLDGDPLDDVANLRKIRAVVAEGRLYDRRALDALLARAREEATR